MERTYRKWWSSALGRDMEILVFGSQGTPVLVFPTSMGRFYQWEDFGVIDHMAPRIEAGWLQLWCVDSVDGESFYAKERAPHERVARHQAYERYLLDEAIPAIRSANRTPFLVAAGASFGATHAALLATRHPGVVGKAVCLSGAYEVSRFLDGWRDGDGYYVDPLAFLPDLTEERYLAPLRQTEFVIATGEDDRNANESRRLAGLLQAKGVSADLHMWNGWAHDWPYWKEMVDVFL